MALAPTTSSARPTRDHGGTTYLARYDGRDVARPDLAWTSRVFVDDALLGAADAPRPLVVLLHGTNVERATHRWMGGATQPDLRALAHELISSGATEPFVLAAPSTTLHAAVPWTMWPAFDAERATETIAASLRGVVAIDPTRVVLIGHSGGACNARGAIFSAVERARTPLHAVLAVDGCMGLDEADVLARAPTATDVVVTWQTRSWRRDFASFRAEIERMSPEGARRTLVELASGERSAHDATLPLTIRRFLPKILPARASVDGAAAGPG